MIITLIGIGLFVLAIIGFVLCYKDVFYYNVGEWVSGISVLCFVVGIVVVFICGSFIIDVNVTAEKDIYNAHLERECIVKQLEIINSDYEDVSKSTVIQNVYDWNEKVHDAKYWSSNPWTSWFWNKKYVDSLEYIELE